MSIIFAFAIYFVVWWICFLMVLPWGIKNAAETGDPLLRGQDTGAPVRPRLVRKLWWTTGIATVIFLVILANSHFHWLTFADLPGPDKLY